MTKMRLIYTHTRYILFPFYEIWGRPKRSPKTHIHTLASPPLVISMMLDSIRDWSLITGRGGGYKTGGGGGHMKFYPYEKGGQKKF